MDSDEHKVVSGKTRTSAHPCGVGSATRDSDLLLVREDTETVISTVRPAQTQVSFRATFSLHARAGAFACRASATILAAVAKFVARVFVQFHLAIETFHKTTYGYCALPNSRAVYLEQDQ